LTGFPDKPGYFPPPSFPVAVNDALQALKLLADKPEALPENGMLLLGERARLMGLSRNGRTCPGGTCKLIDAKDGRFALNMAREDDWDLLPAWLLEGAATWEDIYRIAKTKTADELVTRGIEIGLPIALDEIPESRVSVNKTEFIAADNGGKTPLVVDLSSLWAGPLAGNLLGLMGANVVKVESLSRPDGARRGNTDFYNLLNGNKKCAAFDFSSETGRAELNKLVAAADIVIEASRPRALRQLGIVAEDLLAQKPGKVWLSITAYGRENENRIGFGDDISVAAGLSSIMEKTYGEPCFVGDAIADPISGIFGALAVWQSSLSGGGALLDLSMRDTVHNAIRGWQEMEEFQTCSNLGLWPMRKSISIAEDIGASTDEIMASLC
jgi:hypothetical protein